MIKLKHILIGTTIGAGVISLVSYFRGLQRIQVELLTESKARIFDLGSEGITIQIDVTLKNPTGAALKIKHPLIKVAYKGELIGSSILKNETVDIAPNTQTALNPIMLVIPFKGAFTLAGAMYHALILNEPVAIALTTVSTILLKTGDLPYTKTEPISLKQKQA